jgi:hypothetical protein
MILAMSSPIPAPSRSAHLSKKRKSEPGAVFVLDRLACKDVYRVKLAVAIARDVCLHQIQRNHANIELQKPPSKAGSRQQLHGICKFWPT